MIPNPSLRFGKIRPELTYADRPAAFGVAERDGRVAVVRVTKPGLEPWHDLPGGAVEPGETEAQAAVREFGEEAGLVIAPGEVIDRASQFFISDGHPYWNVGPVLIVEVLGEDASLKIESDHELVWLDPHVAIRLLRHDSHAWAVARWLRQGA